MVKFQEDIHQYTNEQEEVYLSATSLIHKYAADFDSDYWSMYKAIEELDVNFKKNKKVYLRSKTTDYLLSVLPYNITVESVLNEQENILLKWKIKNDNSKIKGTAFHKGKENLILSSNKMSFEEAQHKVQDYKVMFDGKSLAELKDVNYYDCLPDGYYSELLLFHHGYKIAGTSDVVIIKTDELGNRYVIIDDYKTSGKIDLDNRYQKMKYPLNHLPDCVAGDTKLLTKTGIENIKNVVGKEIEIWNGQKWSKVSPFITGTNRELYRVYFSDGSTLDVTEGHKFLIKYRLDKGFEEQKTSDIINKMSKTKWLPRVPNSNITDFQGEEINGAYEYGFVLGDGSIYNNCIRASIYVDSKKLKFDNVKSITNTDKTYAVTFDLDIDICKEIKYNEGLPSYMFSWSKESILKFVSGWLDADGSLQRNAIRLYGDEFKLRDCQLLLTKCGIKSSIFRMAKKGEITNLGVRKNDVWYLSIHKTSDFYCQRIPLLNSTESKCANKWQFIKKIEKLEGLHTTYCLTEQELNQCVFNNVLTKQCNGNHYNLQTSLYGYLLECMGFNVLHTRITWIDSEENEIPYIFDYRRQDVINMLNHYTENK